MEAVIGGISSTPGSLRTFVTRHVFLGSEHKIREVEEEDEGLDETKIVLRAKTEVLMIKRSMEGNLTETPEEERRELGLGED